MRILHRWARRRIENNAIRFMKRIPKQDRKHILSLLDGIQYSEERPEGYQAAAGRLENGKYGVSFFIPHLWYKSSESLLATVAHEFAHVFLEHKRPNNPEEKQACEEAVDRQLEAWGIEVEYFRFVAWLREKYPAIYEFLTRRSWLV